MSSSIKQAYNSTMLGVRNLKHSRDVSYDQKMDLRTKVMVKVIMTYRIRISVSNAMNNMIQVSELRPSWPSCILFIMSNISTIICSTADLQLPKVVHCSLCTLSIFLLKSSKLRLICWICLLWILSASFNAFCVSFSKLFMFSGRDLSVHITYSSNIS